jgi:hypothetical protein
MIVRSETYRKLEPYIMPFVKKERIHCISVFSRVISVMEKELLVWPPLPKL